MPVAQIRLERISEFDAIGVEDPSGVEGMDAWNHLPAPTIRQHFILSCLAFPERHVSDDALIP